MPMRAWSIISAQPIWLNWKAVGESEFRWGFWSVYQAKLLTPTGQFQVHDGNPVPPIALQLTYQMNFKAQALRDETYEQWRKLGYSSKQIQRWGKILDKAWPDVNDGEQLIFQRTHDQGIFWYRSLHSDFQQYFLTNDLDFSDAFLAIWLSQSTQYPDLRRELIGQ